MPGPAPDPPDPTPSPSPEVGDALLALDLVRGVGRGVIHRLLSVFGTPEGVLDARLDALRARTGCSLATASACRSAFNAARKRIPAERLAMRRVGCRLLSDAMVGYPPLLRFIPDPPLLLRIRGGHDLGALGHPRPSIALVGSRRPSAYGRRQGRRFAEFLSRKGVHVVSGGARGIDRVVHQAALGHSGGTTVVLGSGLGRCYPPEHAELFDSIVDAGGCLLSEFPVEAPPRPMNFPRRNRIISGLSLGVLVIEAAARSGALITARLAVEDHGREGGALPGRIEDVSSQGCLRMIAEGWGAAIRSPQEAMDLLVLGSTFPGRVEGGPIGGQAQPSSGFNRQGLN